MVLINADVSTPKSFGGVPMATLNNGFELPLVGLGCSSNLRKEHVQSALQLGYRYLDTAQAYKWGYHEDEVGAAVSDSGLERESVVIQTKISPEDLGYEATKRSFGESLKRLQSKYVDSILIHKPRCWEGACSKKPEGTWQQSWKALEELYDAGQARAIGICDVDDHILDELGRQRHKAHIIQNWMDPFHQDKVIRERCKKEGILYQAYSTLGTQWVFSRGLEESPVLTSPTLQGIASAHNSTVAQVVINWATRHGVAVIPASKNAARQRANLHSFDFELTQEQMSAIDALDGTLHDDSISASDTNVAFQNQGTTALSVFYVDGNGKELALEVIAPKQSTPFDTYHGHKFRFKRNGEIVGEHVVNAGAGRRQSHIVGRGEL